jgi:hypothetical protein
MIRPFAFGEMGPSTRRLILSALAFAGLSLLSATRSYAQSSTPTSASSKPISNSELEKFLVVGSISTCVLVQDKVAFETAVRANVTSIGSLVANLHGSQVQGANDGKPMSPQQLTQGLALQLSALAADRCPKIIPEKDIAEIKRAFSELEKLNSKTQPSK